MIEQYAHHLTQYHAAMDREIELLDFLIESNKIEGIHPSKLTVSQVDAAKQFLKLEVVTVQDVCNIVKEFQPNARLRDNFGLDVRIGDYKPPIGSPEIRERLSELLAFVSQHKGDEEVAWRSHHQYELLHPFTDGNGRSGRLLWLWTMGGRSELGFLHAWYYQSLRYTRH